MYEESRDWPRWLSWPAKQGFWLSMGLLGFMHAFIVLPGPLPVLVVVGFTVLCAISSIAMEEARGRDVMLSTVFMLVVGAAILGAFIWYRQSSPVDPPLLLFDFGEPSPTPSIPICLS
jgi:hypothetical protein